MDLAMQIAASVLAGIATWFVGRHERWMRWGYIIGLCAQPFFLWTLIANEMYGLLLLTFWCIYSWIQGIYNYWIKKGEKTI